MSGEAPGVVEARRGIDEAGELGFESAAAGREAVRVHDAGVAAVAEVEAGLEDRLDLR